jgi:circadian clock protein KaiB
MASKRSASARASLEVASRRARRQTFVLRLYIAGMTPRSQVALRTVVGICEEELAGRCDLEIIDLYEEPARAQREQIVAVPTLVRQQPAPQRKLIGSMSDKERVLTGLGLPPKGQEQDYEQE